MDTRICLFSEEFVISAGCVLFSEDLKSICLLHETKRNEYVLPKGRKDQGESISAAAVRETFEETGYPCQLLATRQKTRAPPAGSDLPNTNYCTASDGTEAIAVHVRPTGTPPIATKIVFWFIAKTSPGSERVHGSQMRYETFDSVFVSIEEATSQLSFEDDRKVVERAIQLVQIPEPR